MTREIDSIIAYHDAARAPGRVTDLNTPGVHSATSAHYAKGSCSPPRPLDHSNGCTGCAVDFAFVPAQSMSPGLLAIWTAFSNGEADLWELFYEGAPYWIKDGKHVPKTSFSTALRNQHKNHVHVALRPGYSLDAVVPPSPTPQPTTEDGMADALVITYPTGAKTIATPDGAIFNAGTPFYGSMYDLPAAGKQGVTSIKALTAADPNNPAAGYVAWAQNGNPYRFDAAEWKKLGH